MFLPYKYIEEADFEKGFAQHYHEHIVPLGKKFDETRGKRQIFHYFNILTALISGLGTSYLIIKSVWFAKFAHGNGKAGRILLFPPFFCWWFFVHRPAKQYFKALKEEVIPKILEFYGKFKYFSTGFIDENILNTHTGYYESFNVFNCEDIILFNKNGLECTIMERVSWDIKKPTGTVFIQIKSKLSFDIDAVIISKARDKKFRIADKKLLKKRGFSPHAALVSQRFDDIFRMHTNDTRINKWLSDDFINALIFMNSAFNEQGLVFSVTDNIIFIELKSQGNLFEIGKSHHVPVANVQDIRNFLSELTTALNLVDAISQIIKTDEENSEYNNKTDSTDCPNEPSTWPGRT